MRAKRVDLECSTTTWTLSRQAAVDFSLITFVDGANILSTPNILTLDNEPASINGDSVQLYALAGERTAGLLLVPEVASVGQRTVDGWTNDLVVDAKWRPTSSGYHLEASIHIDGRTL